MFQNVNVNVRTPFFLRVEGRLKRAGVARDIEVERAQVESKPVVVSVAFKLSEPVDACVGLRLLSNRWPFACVARTWKSLASRGD